MRVVPYNFAIDKDSIAKLLKQRDMHPDLIYTLPEHGMVAFESGELVAAGFIRRIEGNMAMLDSYITNPQTDKAIRHRALDLITKKLVSAAESHNIHKLIAFTVVDSVLASLNKNGLFKVPHTLTAKDGL